MNTDKYIELQDQNLWPVFSGHFPNQPWIFKEDKSTLYYSLLRTRTSTLKKIYGETSNYWKKKKKKKKKRLREIKTDLQGVVIDDRSTITPEYIRSLYDSLPLRLAAVSKAKGYIIKY